MQKYPNAKSQAIATNGMESYEVFNYRKFWKDLLSTDYILKETADLWYKKKLYGKLNLKGELIYPTESRLKEYGSGVYPSVAQLEDPKDLIYGLDFVVDAFRDLQSHFLKAAAGQQLNMDGNLKIINLKPLKGWVSVHQLYNKYLMTLYDELVSTWFKTHALDKDVKDLSSWNKTMLDAIRKNNIEISLSGFIASRITTGRISGLIIEISKESHGDDRAKYRWLEDPNYDFYKSSVQNHGFMIDKNAPWRLIADIEHPQMKLHMENHGLSSAEDLFEEYYYKSYKHDIENLKQHFVDSYNTYAQSYPTFVQASLCSPQQEVLLVANLHKALLTTVDRYPIEEEYLSYTHPDEYWLEMYYFIRCRELHIPEDIHKFNRDIKKIIQIYKRFGLDKTKDYVNMLITNMRSDIF